MSNFDSLKTYISFKVRISGFDPPRLTAILNALSSHAPLKDFKTSATWSSSYIGSLVNGDGPVEGIAITYLYKSDMMINLFQRIVDAGAKANGGPFHFKFCGSYLNRGRFYFESDQVGFVFPVEPFDFF